MLHFRLVIYSLSQLWKENRVFTWTQNAICDETAGAREADSDFHRCSLNCPQTTNPLQGIKIKLRSCPGRQLVCLCLTTSSPNQTAVTHFTFYSFIWESTLRLTFSERDASAHVGGGVRVSARWTHSYSCKSGHRSFTALPMWHHVNQMHD